MEQESQEPAPLLPSTRKLLEITRRTTKRPIVIEPTPSLGARATFTFGSRHGTADRLRYDPRCEEHLDHLVAHEVGHALLIAEAPSKDRVRPVVNDEIVHRDLGAETSRLLYWMAPEQRRDAERRWSRIVVSSLRDLPEDVQIERTIWQERELRDRQRASLRQQVNGFYRALSPQVRPAVPPKVLAIERRVDCAWATWVARLLNEPELVSPFRDAGIEDAGIDMVRQLDTAEPTSAAVCRSATDLLATSLGVRSWYEWVRADR